MSFSFYNKTITAVKKQVYTGNKSTFVTSTGLTASCYLEPLSAEMAAQSGLQWGKSFKVFIDTGINIDDGDLITIASTDYTVKGRLDYDQTGVSNTELIVIKEE